MAKKTKEIAPPQTGLDLRNMRVFTLAIEGYTQTEIANEVGLSRQTVNSILNSAEAKLLVDQARSRLLRLMDLATDTLTEAMLKRGPDMKNALTAAIAVLKGTGALKETAEISLQKPFIMKLLDGGEIVMGHRPEDDKHEI